MARPHAVIDYDTLTKLCGIQCTGEEIAAILGIDYDTLNKGLKREGHGCFTEYFKKHSAKGKMSLRRKQFEVALDGSVPMMIWLGKQHLEQRDKPEESGDEASGVQITFAVSEPVGEIKVTRGKS